VYELPESGTDVPKHVAAVKYYMHVYVIFNMYSVQLAVKTQLIYCTVYTMYKTTCFGLFWPSSGFSYSLESEVSYRQIYHIDDEISFTFYKLLLWREY